MEIGSEDWCAAMSEVLADVELPEVQATVEQRIGDGNGGPVVAYRLVLNGGRAHLEPVPVPGRDNAGGAGVPDVAQGAERAEATGPLDSPIVVMSQSRETVEAVRQGELGALAALQAGLIKVSGDVRVLIAAAEALALVDAALAAALADDHDGAGDVPGNGAHGPDGSNDDADGAAS